MSGEDHRANLRRDMMDSLGKDDEIVGYRLVVLYDRKDDEGQRCWQSGYDRDIEGACELAKLHAFFDPGDGSRT